MSRLLPMTFLCLLLLGIGGCGGSSGSRSLPPQGSAPSTVTGSISGTSDSAQPRIFPDGGVASPPAPSGTPAAPNGLRATTGYRTYERCSDGCSGAVPASQRHPLRLPRLASGSPCPVSPVSGPVKPLGSTQLSLTHFGGGSWEGARVIWTAAATYQGPALIRGRQLGMTGAVGFGRGAVPYDELQLSAPGAGAATPRGTGREWFTYTRAMGPGCYAYQVDGTSFSTVIVFRATG